MKVFLDTNVMLDSALARQETGMAATAILSACEYQDVDGYLSFLTIANMAYILKKGRTTEELKSLLKEYTRYLTVLPMNNDQLQMAYGIEAPDFEDVLQYACAKAGGCEIFVTNNVKHYRFCRDLDVVSTLDYARQFVEK